MSGGTAPAAAIVILFAATLRTRHHTTMLPDKDARAHVPFTDRFLSAPAAASCTSTEGDASRAMSGGTAPAAAIVISFASAHTPSRHDATRPSCRAHVPFTARLLSAPAAAPCTPTEGDASRAMSGGTAPAATIATSFASMQPTCHHHATMLHDQAAHAHVPFIARAHSASAAALCKYKYKYKYKIYL
jgi:hypothetical protein